MLLFIFIVISVCIELFIRSLNFKFINCLWYLISSSILMEVVYIIFILVIYMKIRVVDNEINNILIKQENLIDKINRIMF
jgi:hypothetical protein